MKVFFSFRCQCVARFLLKLKISISVEVSLKVLLTVAVSARKALLVSHDVMKGFKQCVCKSVVLRLLVF
jgi:hypothetical protein